MRLLLKNFLILSFIIALSSCDTTVVFEENKSIEGMTWKVNDPARFEFEMRDTINLYNFYLNLRNGENYPYNNIFFFVEMEFPNGKKSVDTVECFVADPSGKWIGKGSGSIFDNRFLYQHGKQFPLEGRYKVQITQGMRTPELPGVYDVGFRLARMK